MNIFFLLNYFNFKTLWCSLWYLYCVYNPPVFKIYLNLKPILTCILQWNEYCPLPLHHHSFLPKRQSYIPLPFIGIVEDPSKYWYSFFPIFFVNFFCFKGYTKNVSDVGVILIFLNTSIRYLQHDLERPYNISVSCLKTFTRNIQPSFYYYKVTFISNH